MHNSVRLLSATASSHPPPNLRQNVYKNLTHQFSLAPKARIGLAISGGVDSMALATICRDFKKKHSECDFTGFIVDHGARAESGDEASKVATELRNLGIHPEILKLDWSGRGNPKYLANFETVARQLRYQALGKACYQQRVTKILTAHHADDLAETVLSRMIAGYLGEGLQGMKSKTAIPECQGIYGVDASGAPRMPRLRPGSRSVHIESGGVFLHRPLLLFTKNQLIEICQQNKVQWFEDSTNADKTLTVRNTIRHLQSSGQVPAVFQRPRLTALATSLRIKHQLHERRATEIWNDMSVQLNLATGTASFSLPEGYSFGMTADGQPYHVKALLARKLLMLVTPLQAISLQDLDTAIDTFFQPSVLSVAKGQIQGVTVHYGKSTQGKLTLARQAPLRNTVRSTALSNLESITGREAGAEKVYTHATGWLLWDNRYWIRVLHSGTAHTPPPPHFRFSVNFLSPATIHRLRASITGDRSASIALQRALNQAKASRFTQPVLSMKVDDGKSSSIEANKSEQILALPALGWARKDVVKQLGLSYETRYKAVDFGGGKGHVLVDNAESTKKPGSKQRALE
ncbi:Putative tRNA(Ile)-lysidine/2-thiocytidine synthase, tRNA(Ile)-lysidine synthase [Septoria linicola]|uniref:tRNA(Ile)-lysidine synthetase n=1 Tax=Septoria linicola TaxID=215465 RepID=A0A9Q9ENW7_9PEZI|nr:putative tRNA(Ile)-lysidine/2-thiocytidine synthase, tRNA(Ile)-lysidine synthase [Septoria linicola]USW57062.1 Putative tRNA(Ile)-lysidine/2-thiocytidine synthase, tRNA(Ile)-lysidine synthase [Septoria linicola]